MIRQTVCFYNVIKNIFFLFLAIDREERIQTFERLRRRHIRFSATSGIPSKQKKTIPNGLKPRTIAHYSISGNLKKNTTRINTIN